MTEYINKDYYRQIPANERHFIKLSQEAAYAAVKELEAANIPHSATISEYRSIVTVNKADSERAEKIAEKSAREFPNVRMTLGNTEFKYIRDKKYIDTDAETARKIASLLSGNTNNRFSGIIRGSKATITVSGEKNAAAVRAMIDNLKNMDLLEALRERGFERIPDTNGFVNIRNIQTGEVSGFSSMAAVRDMFDNPENDFFYPLSYRIAYREHPTNGDYYYYIMKYNSADKSTAKAYRNGDNKPPIFKSVDEALSYTINNKIEITNIDEEIANWREVDREREDNSIIEGNRRLIEEFPISGGNYVDLVSYNSNTDTFSWVYFNPDGDNGNGAFVDKTITKDDIFAAYSVRIAAESEEQGRNAFIAYLNENCKENVIEVHSGYFAEYADDYINYETRNFAFYFGISENSTDTMSVDNFILHLEVNCKDVNMDKHQREQPQEITERSFRVEFDGYSGAWNVIDSAEIGGRELFMLENDYYGDSLAYIVADKDGNVIDDNVWGDFEEYENTLLKRSLIENAESSEGGTTMPVLKVFADEMKNYGFEVSENDGISIVRREDISSFVRMDIIAEILYDISEKYRFTPNEVGNNHLLDLNRFYDSYDWDSFSIGKNVLENTIIALKSGDFEPIENYIEQVQSVCEVSDSMNFEESKIREVAEHLEKVKSAFAERNKAKLEAEEKFPNGELSDEGKTAEIPQEGNIHFGYFGNGVLCYDVSRLDKEIDDYLSVAHISNEGNIRYYVDDLSESDVQAIENHAKSVKEKFSVYWNGLSLQERYGRLYDSLLSSGTVEQIRAFDADRSVSDMSEKVKKYEHSLIFKDEEFPFNNAPVQTFEMALNDLILEKNREAVEKIEVGGEITLNNEVYVIKNIDGDFSLSMEKKGDSGAEIKRYVGNWKEQLLSEAGDNALFVYSAVLVNDINVINALNAEKSKGNISVDNSEIISNDSDRADITVNFLTDNIPDLDNETAERLVNAFAAATTNGWDKNDNQVKINRIKKALYNILSDEDKTEKAFALISKNIYNYNSDAIKFQFGSENNREWFTESELLHNFVKSNRNTSFALANAVIGYLDEKQHKERENDELNAGWYKKTNFSINANIDGELFSYEGRFDIGDGKGTNGGTLIEHIQQKNEYILKSNIYPYNTKEAKDNAKFILDVFVPFLENYSEMTPEEMEILAEFKENNPIRTSISKNEKTNDDFEIYQVKRGDEFRFKRFVSLSALGSSPDMSDYSLAYSGKLSGFGITAENKDDILDNIYSKFNLNIPADFLGHSLSVSDVIVLHTDGTATAHYVDDIGFKDVPDFLTEKTREQSHILSVGDIVTFADRPNVWRVNAINDLKIDFENTDPNSTDKSFSHIDFGQNRENLQDTLKYTIVPQSMSEQEKINGDKSQNSPMGNSDKGVKGTVTAQKPKKIPNTIPHRNFNKLKKLFPAFMEKNHSYEHYESGEFEPLSAEWIDGSTMSLMHTYREGGSIMRDPDVVLKVDFEKETVNAISFENSGTGIYQEYSDGSKGQKDTNSFMVSWLNNIEVQGYELARYNDIDGNRVDIKLLNAEKAAAEKYREKTRSKFNDIDGCNSDTIEKMVSEYISSVLSENEIEAEIGEVVLYGSRSRGLENGNSDIDIVVQINSDMDEDALFDVLNEGEYKIGGINVDINPIRSEETGTLENYLESAENYLENKGQFALRNDRTYIFSEITFETGEVYLVPGVITDDNIAETAAYKEILELYADRSNIESLDDMIRVDIQTFSYGSGEEYVLSDKEMDYIRENSMGILNQSEEIGNTEFFAHFWKNVDDVLNELDNRAAEQHKTSPSLGDGYEEQTYIFPSDYSSDYPDTNSAVSQLKISGEWLDTEETVKKMNAQGNTDTAQIEALRVSTVSFDGVVRSEEMSPEAFHIILDRTNKNMDKMRTAAEIYSKNNGDIMPVYTKTLAEATAAGEREMYFADRRENQKCASSIDYSISCNNDGMYFDSNKAISDLLNTYSLDRIALIIAARVSYAGEWDRRFSRDNIDWAKSVVKDYPAEQVEAISRLGLKSHSVLLDAAASELKKNYELFLGMQTERKTEVMTALSEPEQQKFNEDIKNLNQLKKALYVGAEFIITDHRRKDSIGERRVITSVKSTGFYSKNPNDENAPDIWLDWGKAGNWNFENGVCTSSLDNNEMVMSFKVLEEDMFNVNTAEIRRKLAERGMVGDEIVDEEKFNNSPFMKQFMQDVENAVRSDRDYADENNPPLGNFTPQINDVVENDEGAYKVANVSENLAVLLEIDTLLPSERTISMTDFYKSNFTLLERGETVAATTEKAVEKVESPVNKAENYSIADVNFGDVGGDKSRYAANIEAIKTLKKIESANRKLAADMFLPRNATPEEQKALAKYTGWGAIPQAFDSTNNRWSNEYAELKELLTPEEYEAARHSTMNAHYTSPTVISAMYDVLNNLGFEKGNILEPAMGTGNFFGVLPEHYKDSKLYGVELDSITGRIAQQLYPNADIQIKGYENTSFPDNSFDVAIGNVPFGDYKIFDKEYNDNNFNIHDYFFAKTLDKVHAGGIIAFVTSKGTMDKENDGIRQYIAERAELLGAIRLPNDAFKATAGTDVTSDILILQKRDKPIEVNPENTEWLKKSETADGLSVNNYFVQHPEMVLGKITEGNKLYGNSKNDTSCIPIEGADLKQQLTEAIKNIKGTYKAADIEIEPQNDDLIPAPENSRTFSFYAQNGNIYYRKDGDVMEKVNISKDVLGRAMGMIELRDNVRELLNLQLENSNGRLDNKVAESREKLNMLYDSFVAKYGNISTPKNAKAFKGDNGYAILSALETKDENGKVIGKADIFTKNTLKPKIIAAHVETAEEALILSVSEKGKVDFDFMTELCGMEKDKLISELDGQIYKLPQETEKYVTADEYLSGNIRKKLLDIANSDDPKAYEKNYEALQTAMPPRVEAKDISVKLGSHWVDPKYIRQFILEKLNPDARTESELNVSYSKVAGTWKIEGQTATAKKNHTATSTYGTHRKHAYEIIEGILNNNDLLVKDRKKDEFGYDMRDEKGNYILITNEEETKAVRHCANIIKSEFVDWIFKDPERREELVQKYNEIFNSFRYREYDGSHLNFVGMNTDITLKEHQKNAIARGLYGGNTLLAHAVGAGKSYEMIAIAMEGKRLGLHNKSLFAVPNSLTEQMGNDFRKLYPNANILVATKKDFEKQNRANLLAKMATNDWDAVIVGHSQFDRMGLSPERESEYLNTEIVKLRCELDKLKAENPKSKSFTVKNIEKSIASYTKRLKDLADKQVKDDFIDFEQLGFDKIFVDECHMYKNLATATKMRNVAGLGSRGSARAFNLLMKAKYLDELTNGNGCVFSSGTPVSNSMTELYTLMRYLQADTLKDLGINHFDEWAADFGEVVTDYELKPESDGKYQLKTRFAKFTNLPELMSIFKQAADIRTADTLDLEKPLSVVQEIVAKPSKIQKRGIKKLGERASQIRLGGVDPREDNMLCVTNDGRKIGLDQRLINPALPDDPNSKVNLCIQNTFDTYTQTADKRSTQCIFCDLSTPKTESRQDRFAIYRPNEETDIGYEVIRKKNGIKKETDFKAIKDYIGKNADEEEDKLQEGDIAVIRRPNEDKTKIISEAAIYENGKFSTVRSDELLERLEMSPIEDMPPKEFNIYDDVKTKLVERGVPEKEIAFIHDYDTAEKKQALFNQMNAGEVRILLGSTGKCGAGMNAQKKLIALHHLDAPMRPSDMEQRDGRIERQGNENPEVRIYRYVTDRTFDAYLYQMLENKQKFISQVMTSKTPERVCSDIDEAALDYAEVKALCAGNPLIKEEMELQNKIKDLKMEKSRYSENIYEMQDKIRVKYPEEIRISEIINKHNQQDLDLANAAEFIVNDEGKKVYPIEICGVKYTDRKEGGNAIKTALGANIGKLAEGKTVEIGTYRGMRLSVFQNSLNKKIGACLEGLKNHFCELNPETDIGNIVRLDNCINNIAEGIKKTNEEITAKKADLEVMKIDVEKPFPRAEELFQAETRLEEVHIELTQFELNDDSKEKDLFERLCDIFPDILTGNRKSVQFEALEEIHTAELKGDLLTLTKDDGNAVTETAMKIDYGNEKAIPFNLDGMELSTEIEEKNAYFDNINSFFDKLEDNGIKEIEQDVQTERDSLSM